MRYEAQRAYVKFSAMQKQVTVPWKKERRHSMRPGRVADNVLKKLGEKLAPENTMASPRTYLPSAHVTGDYGNTIHGSEQPMMTTPALPGGKHEGGIDGVTIGKVSSIADSVLTKIAQTADASWIEEHLPNKYKIKINMAQTGIDDLKNIVQKVLKENA